jgi:hypothetical protein
LIIKPKTKPQTHTHTQNKQTRRHRQTHKQTEREMMGGNQKELRERRERDDDVMAYLQDRRNPCLDHKAP